MVEMMCNANRVHQFQASNCMHHSSKINSNGFRKKQKKITQKPSHQAKPSQANVVRARQKREKKVEKSKTLSITIDYKMCITGSIFIDHL